MRVLILGAAGKAGSAAVSSLLGLNGIGHVYLADHDAEALTKLAGHLGHLPVSPRYLDAESERSLRERMAEADLVLGCLGPFHRHEGNTVRAAIATRRDYLSLCDDPEATEEALSLGAEAARRGVRILCGCGLTPGLSNLLACRAGSRLERVDELEIAWCLEMGSALGTATLEHLLRSWRGGAPVCRGGRKARARAGSWEEMVEFPSPFGWQVVCYLGHPEPVTLPASIGGVLDVGFKAGVGGRGRSLALHSLAWLGEGERTDLWMTALRTAARGIARSGEASCPSAVRVTAATAREGGRKRAIYSVTGDYYRISGLVLAAAVDGLVRRGWPPGVHPPERVLDDPLVFERLRRAGVRILVGEERAGGAQGAGGPLEGQA